MGFVRRWKWPAARESGEKSAPAGRGEQAKFLGPRRGPRRDGLGAHAQLQHEPFQSLANLARGLAHRPPAILLVQEHAEADAERALVEALAQLERQRVVRERSRGDSDLSGDPVEVTA